MPAAMVAACSPDVPIPSSEAVARIDTAREATQAMVRVSAETQELSDAIVRQGAEFPGTVAISVRPLDSGLPIAFEGDRLMPQQSVSKLWVALAAFDKASRGTLDWNERVRIRGEDLTLFYQPIERIVARDGAFDTSFGDLVERALASSDNTANDRLLRRVGGPVAVRAVLRAKDLPDIRFGPGERAMQSTIAGLAWHQSLSRGRAFYDSRDRVPDGVRKRALAAYIADPVDGASANGITLALARLANGSLLPRPQTARFLDILANTKSGPNRLKGGLADGWRIAHKTGTGQVFQATHTGYNDVGILTAPDGAQYAVAVMIAQTGVPVPDRMALMHRVVEAVIQYHAAIGGDG